MKKTITTDARLRPFTQADWDAYSGCDAKVPLMYQADDFAVIVDGTCVLFQLLNKNCDFWTGYYADLRDAQAVGEILAANPEAGRALVILDGIRGC